MIGIAMCMQSHKTSSCRRDSSVTRKKSFFSFSGEFSAFCFRSFPPTRRLPPAPGTPRRALVGRFLPEAHRRNSAARRDGSRPERPPRGGLRGVQHGAVQRFARHVGRQLGRGEAARGGHRRVSVQAVGRGAPGAAGRRERDRRAPGADRHRSALPRQDARPRRRAFRATRIGRVDQRRQDVARRPGGGVARRAVRFRRGLSGRDARRRWRGCSPRLPWSRPRAPTTTRWGPTASAASRA
jgi:hypothetical protein